MNKQNLLNAALAVVQSPKPEAFTMELYGWGDPDNFIHLTDLPTGFDKPHPCGTPACVLGRWAMRGDLQDICYLDESRGMIFFTASDLPASWSSPQILKHFDLSWEEGKELFSYSGCGGAKTPSEAAAYIRNFVERNDV